MGNTINRFIKDTGWSFASLAIAAGVQFILRIFLARYYGPADLGLYTLAFTVYSFGIIFSGFGIGAGQTKYIAENREDSTRVNLLKTNAIIISFLSGCITGLVVYVAAPYIATNFFKMPQLTRLLHIVAWAFPFIALEKATLGYLNGIRKMKIYAFINITQNLLIIILTLTLSLTGHDISYATMGFVFPIILISLVSLIFVRDRIPKLILADYLPVIKMLMVFGFFVVLANGLGMIQTYTDSTLLGYYMTSTDVGLYGVAVVLAQAIILPPSSIQVISGPAIAGYWGKREIYNIETLVNKCMKYTAFYAIVIAFVIGCLSQSVIRLFFGIDYVSVAFPLQIMLVGAVFSSIYTSVGSALSSTAFVKIIFMITGVTVLLNIILNILLIPHFGISGAATATSVTMLLSFCAQNYFVQRLIKIKVDWPWFVKLFGVTIIITTANYLLGRFFNIYAVTAVFLAILLIVMLRYFTTNEDRILIKGLLHIPSR